MALPELPPLHNMALPELPPLHNMALPELPPLHNMALPELSPLHNIFLPELPTLHNISKLAELSFKSSPKVIFWNHTSVCHLEPYGLSRTRS